MGSGNAETPFPGFRGLCAGFQAGTVAVLVMLGWLGIASWWYYHTFWMAPNILASIFYGDRAVRAGFSFHSLSGVALYLVVYSLLGAVFGMLLQNSRNRLRVVLLAVLVAVGWYYVWWAWLWRLVNPLVMIYTHERPMIVGHVLFGLWLGRFPRYLGKEEAPAAPAPEEPANAEKA